MTQATYPQSQPSDQTLCLQCGLCCDGSLFTTVPISPDEQVSGFLSQHAKWGSEEESACFSLPCTAHGGGGCSVYADRPQTCRTYQCKLLKQCVAGKVTWEKAAAIINQTLRHKHRLEAAFRQVLDYDSRENILDVYERFVASWAGRELELRRRYGRLLVEHAAFSICLKRYFEFPQRK